MKIKSYRLCSFNEWDASNIHYYIGELKEMHVLLFLNHKKCQKESYTCITTVHDGDRDYHSNKAQILIAADNKFCDIF